MALRALIGLVACCLALAAPSAASAAPAAVGLGTASSFSVLAGAGITNTGATTIGGDIGTFATTSESGLGTVTLNGVDHAGDAVTQQAKTDLTTAYNQAAGSGPPTSVATELGGTTLTPGVYNGATLQITGTLTLNTLGDPNAVFIFQTASTLITASSSNVLVVGGATACNVYWQVSSSATLGTSSNLIGTVMASTSITADNGATIQGRLLASTGAVTLDHNTINAPVCAPPSAPTTTSTTPSGSPTSTTPTGASAAGARSAGGRAPRGATGRTQATTPSGSTTGTSTNSGGIPPQLAFSGFPSGRVALLGGGLLLAGSAALTTSRRRRHR